ncbi:MAG: hypothetical protein KGL03_00495 [Nitrospirota bacterium]|nr:hypothetical protein [Nitrospirota bacterium]
MSVQNPSGMATLARLLRGRGKGLAVEPKPAAPALLLQDVQRILRTGWAETPRRVLLPGYATSTFRESASLLDRLQPAGRPDLVMAYSIKTNPSPALLGLARDAGLWAEAIAQSEVTHAVGLGFPPEQIVLNGPGKWWLAPVKTPRYGAIFCDSLQELRMLRPRLSSGDLVADYVGLRLRPATVNSRFGIGLHEPAVLAEAVALLKRLPRRQGLGFHFHIASSLFGVRTWHSLAENFLAAVGLLCDRLRGRPVVVSFGGGWHPDDWSDFLRGEFRQLVTACRRQLPMVRRIILEPGKALSQRSMCLLTHVIEVRRSRTRTELVVDASVAELPDVRSHPHRIASLGPSGRLALWGTGPDRVLGRLCMEFDILSDSVQAPKTVRQGDLLAYLDAGAYDASMAYSFGSGGLPLTLG